MTRASCGRAICNCAIAAFLCAGVDALLSGAYAQVVYVDVQKESGILPYTAAIGPHSGIAAEDYDGDGFIDLFVPNGEGVPNQFYHNLGNGLFEEIATQVGLASLENHRTALWLDYDGDHDLDLVLGGDCGLFPAVSTPCPGDTDLRLYRHEEDGTFEDVTLSAGLDIAWGGAGNIYRSGISAGDLNNDGYLDLIVAGWTDRLFLFLNNTDGTFTDITAAAGISTLTSRFHQTIFHDFDRDGLMDIYIAIDSGFANRLYLNQGDSTFVNVAAAAGVDNTDDDMGVALGDYNNDGRLDMYVTVVTLPQFVSIYHNPLYRNNADPGEPLSYTDVSMSLEVHDTGWGWGVTFVDCDNDGWQDIAVTNGSHQISWQEDSSRFFLNPGPKGGDFIDVSDAVGFNDTYQASGLVAFDSERDGDLDLAQTTKAGLFRVLRCDQLDEATLNHYLVVQPRMARTNHWAIGAVVTINVGGLTTARAILAGTSQDCQEPAEASFGLGRATIVDQVRVEWPGGGETILTDVAADQVLVVNDVVPPPPSGACCLSDGTCEYVTESECADVLGGVYLGDDMECATAKCAVPCPTDFDGSGEIGFADLLQLLAAWGPCAECPQDLDASGDVGFADLLRLLATWGPCA